MFNPLNVLENMGDNSKFMSGQFNIVPRVVPRVETKLEGLAARA
jgi:hypothetical protein